VQAHHCPERLRTPATTHHAFARHSGAGRRRFSTDEGLVIQRRRCTVVAKTHRSCYWIPACAGMTSGPGARNQDEAGCAAGPRMDASRPCGTRE
jgi:hypothetical protein